MLVGLFFTYEYSLKTWHESGTLNKELEIYKMLNEKYGVRFKFITYGDKNEIDYVKGYDFRWQWLYWKPPLQILIQRFINYCI